VQPVTTAVAKWLNDQQVAGRLDEKKMADYARVFHAIAAAIKPTQTVTPTATKQPESSPCANGKCPAPGQPQRRAWRIIDR